MISVLLVASLAWAQEDVADLVRRLGDDDPAVRDRAQAALEQLGVGALAAVRKAAASGDPEIAVRAKRVLAEIDPEEKIKLLAPEPKRVTLTLEKPSLEEALRAVAAQTGCEVRLGEGVGRIRLPSIRLDRVTTLEALSHIVSQVKGGRLEDESRGLEFVYQHVTEGHYGIISTVKGPARLEVHSPSGKYLSLGLVVDPSHRKWFADIEILDVRDAAGNPWAHEPPPKGSNVTIHKDVSAGLSRLKVLGRVHYALKTKVVKLIDPAVEERHLEEDGFKISYKYCPKDDLSPGCLVLETAIEPPKDPERAAPFLSYVKGSRVRGWDKDGKSIQWSNSWTATRERAEGLSACGTFSNGPQYQPSDVARLEVEFAVRGVTRTYEFELSDLKFDER